MGEWGSRGERRRVGRAGTLQMLRLTNARVLSNPVSRNAGASEGDCRKTESGSRGGPGPQAFTQHASCPKGLLGANDAASRREGKPEGSGAVPSQQPFQEHVGASQGPPGSAQLSRPARARRAPRALRLEVGELRRPSWQTSTGDGKRETIVPSQRCSWDCYLIEPADAPMNSKPPFFLGL